MPPRRDGKPRFQRIGGLRFLRLGRLTVSWSWSRKTVRPHRAPDTGDDYRGPRPSSFR